MTFLLPLVRFAGLIPCLLTLSLAGCLAPKSGLDRPVAEDRDKEISQAMRQQMAALRKRSAARQVAPAREEEATWRAAPSASPGSLSISDTFGLEFFINERLSLYREKDIAAHDLDFKLQALELALTREERWHECLDSLAGLNEGYQFLWDDYQQNGKGRMAGNDFLHVCRDDIVFLEGSCPEVELEVSRLLTDEINLYQETALGRLVAAMEYYGLRDRYPEVRSIYQRLQKEVGNRPLPASWQEVYGRALVGCGRLTAALSVFRNLAEVNQGEVGARARLQMVELLIALGRIDQARKQSFFLEPGVGGDQAGLPPDSYRQIFSGQDQKQQPVKLYGEMLHSWLIGNKSTLPLPVLERLRILERYFPDSDAVKMGQRLRLKVEQQVALQADQLLQRARMLQAEGKYSQALALLLPLEDGVLPIAARRAVQQLVVDIEQVRDGKRALARRLRQEALESGWQQANNLFDQKKYDRAYVSFHGLLNTSYRSKVKKKLVMLARQAAADLRQAAARSFVKSRETSIPEQKLGHLADARDLLRQIIDKYPEVAIIDKVRANLVVIEDEIRALGLTGISL